MIKKILITSIVLLSFASITFAQGYRDNRGDRGYGYGRGGCGGGYSGGCSGYYGNYR